MNNYQKLAFILGVSSLTGCSYLYSEEGIIKDRTFEYLEAKEEKALVLPADLKQKNNVNYAQVPNIGESARKAPYGKELSVSAPTQILSVLESTRLDKKSELPAVFIADDFDFIWQTIISVFEEQEISVKVQDKAQRLIDTGWLAQDTKGIWLGLENEAEIDEFRTRYEIKVTKGDLKNEYRVQAQRIKAEKMGEDGKWKPVPNFWHDSAEMLNLVISKYDQRVAQRDVENRNKAIAGFKVELSTDAEGNAALVTEARLEDVWTKLPEVLLDLGFSVNDRDRQLMTYYTEFLAEEEGFFASLFSDDREPLQLEAGNYQISVSQVGSRAAITFKNDQGTALDSALITKLFPQISARFREK